MNVSIIGTNGFLSNSLSAYCNSNLFKLFMYGRTEPKLHSYTEYYYTDLLNVQLNYDVLTKSDVIIYTAGAGIQAGLKEKPNLIYNLNVTIPVQICNDLKEANYKGIFVSFGSYFEIGETTIDRQFTETEVIQSNFKAPNDYTISKRMLSRFISSFNAPFTFLHFILPTIYGELELSHRLIPYTLHSIKENTDLRLTSGEQVRQYIHVDNVAEIIFNAINANLISGIYNMMGTEELSVKQLVTMLFNLMEKPLPKDIFGKTERADVGMKILKLNSEKLQNCINTMPKTKISDIYKKYKFE